MFEAPNLRRRRQTVDDPYSRRPPPRKPRARGKQLLSSKQKITLFAAALASLVGWYLTSVSIWITNFILHQVPVSADIELGQKAVAKFPRPTVYDPDWTLLIQQVGNELVRTRQKQSFDGEHHPHDYLYQWDFGVIEANLVNAFSFAGGVVRVTDGLLELIEPTKGELAALLGHEMGHVVSRHSQARMVQEELLLYLFKAVRLYKDGDDVKETFGQAAVELLTKSLTWQGQQRFTKLDEYEADAVSWELLADESNAYNPRSLHSILTKLYLLEQKANNNFLYNQESETSWDIALMKSVTAWGHTHPGTKERLNALDDKWKQLSPEEQRRLSLNPR
jgi:predicted Zn-dependent protease